MGRWDRISRRTFVTDLGRGALGLAILGTACGSDPSAPASDAPSDRADEPDQSGSSAPSAPDAADLTGERDLDWSWERIVLGGVSAYLVAHRGAVVLVDTGTRGSEDDIAAALEALGLGWGDVGDVVLTHRHPDHVGSVPAVLAAAPDAQGHIGAGDLDAVTSPRPLRPLLDGDTVAGLDVVATPGHTAGHISVLDRDSGVLVAGDALNGGGGRVTGANPQYTSDMDEANRSIRHLATLEFETVLFGHGDPVVGGASAAVAELAESL